MRWDKKYIINDKIFDAKGKSRITIAFHVNNPIKYL